MPLDKKDDPSNPSSDCLAMQDDWTLIADIRAGVRAIKAKREKYLPRFVDEKHEAYKRRLAATPWRPEFVDALRNLCSKPFTKEVALQGDVPSQVKPLAEDIDGAGNNLHVFARDTFENGVAAGLDIIYVTFPAAPPAPTLAQERASGVRPYWVHIRAPDILALYTTRDTGRERVDYIRYRECVVSRDGFDETVSDRVRVIEMVNGVPTWTVYEKHTNAVTKEITWAVFDSGTLTLGFIPMVLFFTGQRTGNYQVKPPLSDLAYMQIEIYQALCREDEILTYAGFPMLKATGMSPPQPTQRTAVVNGRDSIIDVPASEIKVGPQVVLFAPPSMDGVQPNWDFIQPNAANITAISTNVKDKIEQFRRLALQPTTSDSGRLTATSAAIDSAKAHSAIETWANVLKDALEQAWVFTCAWLNIQATVEVSVHTDFGVDLESADEYGNLIKMRSTGDLSQQTLWQEGQRRGILGPQFDADRESEEIAKDQADHLVPDQNIDPLTGRPLAEPPQPEA